MDFVVKYAPRGPGGNVVEDPPVGKKRYTIRPSLGGGNSYSKFRTTHKTNLYGKEIKSLTPPQVYVVTAGLRATCISGSQSYVDHTLMTRGDVLAYYNNTPNKNYTTPLYIQTVIQDCMITNLTNTNVTLTIYEVRIRKTTTESPATALTASLSNMGATATTQFAIGLTPFDSSIWCRYYKVLKSYVVELPLGRTHVHKSIYKVNKKVQYSEINMSDQYIPGLSHGLLIAHHGMPGESTSVGTPITTAPESLAMVFAERHRFRYVTPVTSGFYAADNLERGATVKAMDTSSGAFETAEQN